MTYAACRFHGHDPVARDRRVPWAPWRTRPRIECRVCGTPLTEDQIAAAHAAAPYGPIARRTC